MSQISPETPKGRWLFFWPFLRSLPRSVKEAAEHVTFWISIVVAAVLYFNKDIAKGFDADGISRWWTTAPVAVIVVNAFLNSVYSKYKDLAEKYDNLSEKQRRRPVLLFADEPQRDELDTGETVYSVKVLADAENSTVHKCRVVISRFEPLDSPDYEERRKLCKMIEGARLRTKHYKEDEFEFHSSASGQLVDVVSVMKKPDEIFIRHNLKKNRLMSVPEGAYELELEIVGHNSTPAKSLWVFGMTDDGRIEFVRAKPSKPSAATVAHPPVSESS